MVSWQLTNGSGPWLIRLVMVGYGWLRFAMLGRFFLLKMWCFFTKAQLKRSVMVWFALQLSRKRSESVGMYMTPAQTFTNRLENDWKKPGVLQAFVRYIARLVHFRVSNWCLIILIEILDDASRRFSIDLWKVLNQLKQLGFRHHRHVTSFFQAGLGFWLARRMPWTQGQALLNGWCY